MLRASQWPMANTGFLSTEVQLNISHIYQATMVKKTPFFKE
jgi:hypothetical protein